MSMFFQKEQVFCFLKLYIFLFCFYNRLVYFCLSEKEKMQNFLIDK